jgi:general secretion pathway protein J
MKRPVQSGFTLIELLIAITLVAAISAGLLTTMRNALLTMQRTQQRLEENRRALGIQDLIRRQIGGAMPVKGQCGPAEGAYTGEIFRGNSKALLLVTNESMTEGSRGYPRIVLYRVMPNPNGTVRLEMFEELFSGPGSTASFCAPDPKLLNPPPVAPLVLFDQLAYCRFLYQNLNINTLLGREPAEDWQQPILPYAVRIDLAPAPDREIRMPVGSITIPLRISRSPDVRYENEH